MTHNFESGKRKYGKSLEFWIQKYVRTLYEKKNLLAIQYRPFNDSATIHPTR